MSSAEFHKGLTRQLPPEAIRLKCEAASLDAEGVTLTSGERIPARAVIDCRPFAPTPHLNGGWQVFMGRHIRLDPHHGIENPVIMDAAVDQLAPHGNGGAYRFMSMSCRSARMTSLSRTPITPMRPVWTAMHFHRGLTPIADAGDGSTEKLSAARQAFSQ